MSGLIDQVEMQQAREELRNNNLHVDRVAYINIKSKGIKNEVANIWGLSGYKLPKDKWHVATDLVYIFS